MSETITAGQADAKVRKAAEACPDLRDFTSPRVRQVVRQGDIYIHCVAPEHRRGAKARTAQLAVGDTQGSRHVASGDCQVFVGTTSPPWCGGQAFLGPCVVVGKGGAIVTHPEHAHVALGEGVYQVTHQLDAATQQRVAD